MSMQAAQVALFAKLFWIWIGLLISVFVNHTGFRGGSTPERIES